MTTPNPTPDDLAGLAAKLSEEHRVAWIKTILAMAGTDPQRNAFVDGYNDMPITPWASPRMIANHELGQQVRTLLMEKPDV